MIASKMSQHFRLSKRGSKIGLVINTPAKYVANFFSFYIFLSVNCWFKLVFLLLLFIITIVNTNVEYGLNQNQNQNQNQN